MSFYKQFRFLSSSKLFIEVSHTTSWFTFSSFATLTPFADGEFTERSHHQAEMTTERGERKKEKKNFHYLFCHVILLTHHFMEHRDNRQIGWNREIKVEVESLGTKYKCHESFTKKKDKLLTQKNY